MDKQRITKAVDMVITEASKAKGWSLAKLTRHLGKGANTLHRWKTGQTNAYDMDALIKLFKIAGMSMDEVFGLSSASAEPEGLSDRQYESLRSAISRIDQELAQLRPLARLTAAVSGIVTALSANVGTEPDDEPPTERSAPAPAAENPTRAEARAATLGAKLAEAQAKSKSGANKKAEKNALRQRKH